MEPLNPTRQHAKSQRLDARPARGWRRVVNLNTIGIALVVLSCVASLYQVLSIRHAVQDPSLKIIRMAHW